MTPLFKKLNFKSQSQILILNSPDSFTSELEGMRVHTSIIENLAHAPPQSFAIAFVTQKAGIDALTPQLDKLLVGDATLWFAYPKSTSRNYHCDFNRDTGWDILGKYGFEGVRQVAIDADWTALRFRRVAFIQKMSRRKQMAMSNEGKEKTTGK